MKTSTQWVILGACCAAIAILALGNRKPADRSSAVEQKGPALTLAHVKSIQPGMNFQKVEELLGKKGALKNTGASSAEGGEGSWAELTKLPCGVLLLKVNFDASGAVSYTGTVLDEATGQSTDIAQNVSNKPGRSIGHPRKTRCAQAAARQPQP